VVLIWFEFVVLFYACVSVGRSIDRKTIGRKGVGTVRLPDKTGATAAQREGCPPSTKIRPNNIERALPPLFFSVEVFSTNYRRTMLSAQGFLDGFLAGRGGVPVVVPPRAENFLNQWESRGHEMYGVLLFSLLIVCSTFAIRSYEKPGFPPNPSRSLTSIPW